MPRPPLWYLQKIDLFANLSDEEMMELIEGMDHCEYPVKHTIYSPNDTVEHTYILKEGEVTLYQVNDGKRIVIDILKPGAVFGNIGFDPQENGTYAETSQKAFICILPQDFFLQLMQKNPKMAAHAFNILSKQIVQYQSQLRFLSVLNARDRILATIRLLNEKEEQSILPAILRKPTKITHEKLASMTGLTRETVTKQLQKLEEEECVHTQKKHIRLTEKGKQEASALGQ